jgi:small-conductance mechanosensitive channel
MTDIRFRQTRRHLLDMSLMVGLLAIAPLAAAQPGSGAAAVAAAAVDGADVSQPPARLIYGNREIIEFRTTTLGRPPADRAAAAGQVLDRLGEEGITRPVEPHAIGPVMAISVGGRDVFAILPSDVDTLTGGTLDETATNTATVLQMALAEIAELERPSRLLFSITEALLATGALFALFWGLARARTALGSRLTAAAGRRLQASPVGDLEFVRSSRLLEFVDRIVGGVAWGLSLFGGYLWLSFVLRRFPYSRPWGESLSDFLLGRLSLLGLGILAALPNLFTVLMIVLLTRFAARIVQMLFRAVEDGRLDIPWVYPETAQPTRKLTIAALWLFAVAVAYPYLPGSESEAFKGVSVFVGLMLSLGSSGIVNQLVSGLTLTYSRALRLGDFVAVAEVEGTVTQLGSLSTKVRTARGEDVTIPNAVIVAQTVTNYSRFADTVGVFVPTSVTVGYDVAWRQVKALLLLAAARTPGIRREPAPIVNQSTLEEVRIKYTLLFCLEVPAQRAKTLAAVHANILDAFNEYGVQITTPNYEADPPEPKLVPRERWFASPATGGGDGEAPATARE